MMRGALAALTLIALLLSVPPSHAAADEALVQAEPSATLRVGPGPNPPPGCGFTCVLPQALDETGGATLRVGPDPPPSCGFACNLDQEAQSLTQ